MSNKLSGFTVEPLDEGYLIQVEQEDGDAIELTATYDQLDMIAQTIDDLLDKDEEDQLGIDTQ